MGTIRKPLHGPEWHTQQSLIEFLEDRGWLVERMIGNAFQIGIPDLYAWHPKWGQRWIDVKNRKRWSFTRAQRIKWPKWEKKKLGVWILTDATQEEYDKLFRSPNFRDYWKPSYNPVDVDRMIDELSWEQPQQPTQQPKSRSRKNRSVGNVCQRVLQWLPIRRCRNS